jgi:hypothetical protein
MEGDTDGVTDLEDVPEGDLVFEGLTEGVLEGELDLEGLTEGVLV